MLAKRVALAALVVLATQLAIEVSLQFAFSQAIRVQATRQLVVSLDGLGGFDNCESWPTPLRHERHWWTAWPVNEAGQVLGAEPPHASVDLPAPDEVRPILGHPHGLVYRASATGCSGILMVPRFGFPVIEAMSTEIFLFGTGRILLVLLTAVALVAVTAWPLVRRIRALSGRMTAVVDDDFAGTTHDGADDELGDLAGAFDAAAVTARERLQRLEHRDRVLRVALADLAHDLRTPLATLKLSASSLSPTSAAASIRAELNYLDGLTQNFEALLGGTKPDERETVALDLLVQRLRHRFAPMAADRDLSFDVALPDQALWAWADAVSLERAVSNLVHNALRWASGHVVLLLYARSGEAWLEVRDDGPGLGETDVAERGIRGPDARGEGFGLGLAIAEAAARRFGGRLELENGPDGGTVAAIVLPLETEHA